jgi:beta-hydroxylase
VSDVAYKIVSAADWVSIQAAGGYDGSAVDLRDGYIHLSAADQLAGTAAKHYAGRVDLRLLDVDLASYGQAIVWEPSRGGALFPHLYGRLSVASVSRVRAFYVRQDGEMVFEEDPA